MSAFLIFVFDVTVAYLMGSLSSAIIVSRLFGLPDPRTEGSKNPGATNVLRLAGNKYAGIVLIADMLKGLLPVLLAKWIGADEMTLGFTCFAAVIGHIYPIFFQFKGGKGVATALGSFFALHLIMGAVILATWLTIVNFSRYSSLASIAAITFAPFYSLFVFGNANAFFPLALITIFVLYQHRENISRLMVGEEPKISFKINRPKDKS
jgi:glycerol-3-phosphate acyltransferase PlsY